LAEKVAYNKIEDVFWNSIYGERQMSPGERPKDFLTRTIISLVGGPKEGLKERLEGLPQHDLENLYMLVVGTDPDHARAVCMEYGMVAGE